MKFNFVQPYYKDGDFPSKYVLFLYLFTFTFYIQTSDALILISNPSCTEALKYFI